jgi:uncharacterized protein (TIGR01244 family)
MTDFNEYAPGMYSGGQPTPADLARLATRGVRTVINLRGANEDAGFDEPAESRRLGLRYVSIPIGGPEDVTPDAAARFTQALDAARGEGGTLVHCASGNRVGALVALDQGLGRGATHDAALALGRAAGLVSLAPRVAQLLAESPAG